MRPVHMTNDAPIAKDELRISVEAGDDYHASPRVAAALQELANALEEVDSGDDVAGFADVNFQPGFSMFYVGKVDFSYTENDSKGKKKGNGEYSWKVEKGV